VSPYETDVCKRALEPDSQSPLSCNAPATSQAPEKLTALPKVNCSPESQLLSDPDLRFRHPATQVAHASNFCLAATFATVKRTGQDHFHGMSSGTSIVFYEAFMGLGLARIFATLQRTGHLGNRGRANIAHMRQSGPDYGLSFKVKVLKTFGCGVS